VLSAIIFQFQSEKALTALDKATGGVEDLKKEIGKYGGKKRKSRKRRTSRKKRSRRKKGGNEEDCPICMEEITPNERLTTSCNHNFHRQCFINNCLAELNKGNFDAREEEDEVFQHSFYNLDFINFDFKHRCRAGIHLDGRKGKFAHYRFPAPR